MCCDSLIYHGDNFVAKNVTIIIYNSRLARTMRRAGLNMCTVMQRKRVQGRSKGTRRWGNLKSLGNYTGK